LKRSIKTASSESHLENKIFAQQVLKTNITTAQVSEILAAKQDLLDVVETMQSRDSISGDMREIALMENQ
jgi:hypothetical protein